MGSWFHIGLLYAAHLRARPVAVFGGSALSGRLIFVQCLARVRFCPRRVSLPMTVLRCDAKLGYRSFSGRGCLHRHLGPASSGAGLCISGPYAGVRAPRCFSRLCRNLWLPASLTRRAAKGHRRWPNHRQGRRGLTLPRRLAGGARSFGSAPSFFIRTGSTPRLGLTRSTRG